MFIKKETAIELIDTYAQALYEGEEVERGRVADYCSTLLANIDEEYVVDIEQYHQLNFQCTVLKALLKGEWVQAEYVKEALNITFDQCMKMFELGVGGPWNDPEDIRFRISQKTIDQNKMKDFEEDFKIQEAAVRSCSNPDSHQWELILEQQGGII